MYKIFYFDTLRTIRLKHNIFLCIFNKLYVSYKNFQNTIIYKDT